MSHRCNLSTSAVRDNVSARKPPIQPTPITPTSTVFTGHLPSYGGRIKPCRHATCNALNWRPREPLLLHPPPRSGGGGPRVGAVEGAPASSFHFRRKSYVESRAPSTTPSGWSPSPANAVADK